MKLPNNKNAYVSKEKLLLQIAKINEVKEVKETIYGTNYVIEGKMETPSGKIVTIATVWFVQKEKGRPSFVTVYPV